MLVSPTIAVGGSFKLRVPGLGALPFGNAYAAYSYPDLVSLGGSVRIPAPGMAVNAGVTGELAVGKALFDFHGFAEACIAGLACLVRADAWVTSTGVVVCGSIPGELHPGVGYRWGDVWPTIWLVDGCKPSRYWVNVRQLSRGARTWPRAPPRRSPSHPASGRRTSVSRESEERPRSRCAGRAARSSRPRATNWCAGGRSASSGRTAARSRGSASRTPFRAATR